MAAKSSEPLTPQVDVAGDHFEDHLHVLSAEEICEIEKALEHFKSLGQDGDEVGTASFPLPQLGPKLRALSADLHGDGGFFVLRGLQPHDLSPEDNILIYMGICGYIADTVGVQDGDGHVFAHIREARYSLEPQESRPVRDSTLPSSFHTDQACDIVAMQTRGVAEIGGNHIVSSAMAVYQALRLLRPDVLKLLLQSNWFFDHRGWLAQPEGRPILYLHEGRPIFNLIRQALVGVPGVERDPGVPPLTSEQREALDVVEELAQQFQLVLPAEVGDLTFVNNFTMLHAREGFVDSAQSTRHLIRMWLKNSRMAYDLPSQLKENNTKIFDYSVEREWNILPKTRLNFTVAERLCP